jgi:hypothetical protein
MQNWVATLALLIWPLVVLGLYRALPAARATIWAILAAYLLLPVNASIKIEGIPQFNKTSIPALAAVACLLIGGQRLQWFRRLGLAEVLVLVFIFSPLITALQNGDAIGLANRTIPGETLYDGASAATIQLIYLIPFLLGRQLLRESQHTEEILRALVMAGLFYSLPMLFEVRMSPQLHTWVYGYFPHQFAQAFRDGGFRPVVFLGHGLLVAFFAATTVIAAAAFWRTETRLLRLPPAGITAYLTGVLVLCKSLGALIYGVVLGPLVRWAQPRLQMRIAVVLAVAAFSYPLLRTIDAVPTSAMVGAAAMVSEERAASLKTRLDNEGALLARASERAIFGWGRWGRNRIYDDESGQDMSITDGRWIITLGGFGIIGFVAEFGLLLLPIVRAASARRFAESPRDSIFLGAMTLILAANMIELIPNSTLSPWTWLMAGALLGRAEALRSAVRQSGALRPAGAEIGNSGRLIGNRAARREF